MLMWAQEFEINRQCAIELAAEYGVSIDAQRGSAMTRWQTVRL
jgi:hypothetical protein